MFECVALHNRQATIVERVAVACYCVLLLSPVRAQQTVRKVRSRLVVVGTSVLAEQQQYSECSSE